MSADKQISPNGMALRFQRRTIGVQVPLSAPNGLIVITVSTVALQATSLGSIPSRSTNDPLVKRQHRGLQTLYSQVQILYGSQM